jgi:hypothetical protein
VIPTAKQTKSIAQCKSVLRRSNELLFRDVNAKGVRESFQKSLVSDSAKSNQRENRGGRVEHPFDYVAVGQFKNANPYHSTCLEAKVAATTGINFYDAKEKVVEKDGTTRWKKKQSKVSKNTSKLCENPFISELNAVCEDYWTVAVGYLEVVRDSPNGRITGLHHLPARRVWKYLERDGRNHHYEIDSEGWGGDQKFAAFGDSAEFFVRNKLPLPEGTVSEVICFRQPSSQSRHYSIPDWVSAVQPIELIQCILQYKFDFFQNRGVPEFLLFILGQIVDEATWTSIEQAMQANMGLGNSHKSTAINLSNPDAKVQVEKLAMDNKLEDEINASSDPLALMIVSAHRVPPLLAGIQVPGKLGATNELPNALTAFQKLVIDEAQTIFQETLGKTLGDSSIGIRGLGMDDFAFSSILDEFNLGGGNNALDTMSRMREPVTDTDRDLNDGLRD